jgi:hypothetical protein
VRSFRLIAASVCLVIALAGCTDSHPGTQSSSRGAGGLSARLHRIAGDTAHDTGATMIAAQAVRTTEAYAIHYVTGSDVRNMSRRAVWLLQVKGDGQFSCECAVRPGADGEIDPRYLIVLVDAVSYRIVWGAALLTDPLGLTGLGRVVTL